MPSATVPTSASRYTATLLPTRRSTWPASLPRSGSATTRDPLPPESEDALEYVARHVDLPIAAGERSYNLFQFAELIGRRIAAFVRPDLSLAGGITQIKKIAAVAEANFVRVFPHLMGSPVNTCAFAQLAAAIPNYYIQEANLPHGAACEIVDAVPQVVDGYLQLPDRPGIGIEIDESAAARFPFQPPPRDRPPQPRWLRPATEAPPGQSAAQSDSVDAAQFPESSLKAANVSQVKLYSPLRYPGGKTWLIPHVKEWLTKSRAKKLIEPFAGGAIVSLTAVMERLVNRAILIERDPDVAAFWRATLQHGAELADRVRAFCPTPESILELEPSSSARCRCSTAPPPGYRRSRGAGGRARSRGRGPRTPSSRTTGVVLSVDT